MREGLTLALKLGLMMLVAGLCLAMTNYITEDPIEEQRLLNSSRLRAEVLSQADNTSPVDVPDAPATLLAAYTADNGAGYVFEMQITGFGGPMAVTVGIQADGTIEGVRIGDHSETPGLGAKAANEAFYGQYSGKNATALTVTKSAPGDGEIQAITAATITSSAVTNAVNDAIACFQALQ